MDALRKHVVEAEGRPDVGRLPTTTSSGSSGSSGGGGVPKGLVALLTACWSSEQQRRPTAQRVALVLQRLVAGENVEDMEVALYGNNNKRKEQE